MGPSHSRLSENGCRTEDVPIDLAYEIFRHGKITAIATSDNYDRINHVETGVI